MNPEGTSMVFPFRDSKSRPFSEILERSGDAGLQFSCEKWKFNATG